MEHYRRPARGRESQARAAFSLQLRPCRSRRAFRRGTERSGRGAVAGRRRYPQVGDTSSRGRPVLLRSVVAVAALTAAVPRNVAAQAPGRWPPDSLINTQVIPRGTPVVQVIGQMRNVASGLGVRCQFCHVGEEGMPLPQFDFASDQKRTKLVARQMMRMVAEINRRLDTLPGRTAGAPVVTCATCHHGVSRPVPLYDVLVEAAQAGGADSAVRAYTALRTRYFGRDAYDFGEPSLNIAAFRLGRAGRVDDGLALLAHNETLFPRSSNLAVFRGNILLMRADTAGAAAAFQEALRRDSANGEARGRLRDIRR